MINKMFNGNFNEGTKGFLLLTVSNFVSVAILGFFWIFLASITEKSEYGEIGFWISIAYVGAAFAAFGLPKTMIVYGSRKENIVFPIYGVGFLSSAIVAIITYVIFSNVFLSLLIFGLIVFQLYQSELNSKRRYVKMSLFKLLRSVVTVIFAITLYYYLGEIGIVFGFLIGTFPSFVGVYNFIRADRIGITVLKLKIKFMLNNWFSDLAKNNYFWGDKIIVGVLFGFSILGSYQLASQYFLLLNIFPIAVASYLLPSESVKRSEKKIKILALMIACLLAIISLVVVPSFVDIFFPQYQESILPMQIMSLAVIPFTIFAIQESKLLGNEQSKVVMIGSIFGVGIYFVLVIILGNWFGLVGLAVAFLIGSTLRIVFYSLAEHFKAFL